MPPDMGRGQDPCGPARLQRARLGRAELGASLQSSRPAVLWGAVTVGCSAHVEG